MADNTEKLAVQANVHEFDADSQRSSTLGPSPVHEMPSLLRSGSKDSQTSNLSRCTTTKDPEAGQKNPFSAFYCHPTTRCSFEQQKSESRLVLALSDVDLEQGPQPPSPERQPKECNMWPARQTLKERAKQEKKKRGLPLLRKLNKKQKIWVKVAIALFVIALAVGLGVGISKAVGGGIWKSGS